MSAAPWTRSYPQPVRWDGAIEAGPAYAVLDDAAERIGDGPAVEFAGRRATDRRLRDANRDGVQHGRVVLSHDVAGFRARMATDLIGEAPGADAAS